MSQLVQLEGKHTTQTAHRALSVIAYIATIAKLATLSRYSFLIISAPTRMRNVAIVDFTSRFATQTRYVLTSTI